MSPRGRVTAAVAAVGLQLAVLYAPRVPTVGTAGFPVDKVVHVIVFLVPTVALVAAGVPRRWALGLMAVHAPISEVIQGLFFGARSGDVADVAADLTGVALGAYLTRRGGWGDPKRAHPPQGEEYGVATVAPGAHPGPRAPQ
jgi:hypothetical protein